MRTKMKTSKEYGSPHMETPQAECLQSEFLSKISDFDAIETFETPIFLSSRISSLSTIRRR